MLHEAWTWLVRWLRLHACDPFKNGLNRNIRAGNGSMGHGSQVKWVTKIGWVTWVMGH